jgi:hypothetical protein
MIICSVRMVDIVERLTIRKKTIGDAAELSAGCLYPAS